MPRAKQTTSTTEQEVTKASSFPGPIGSDKDIDRFKMSESGYVGLNMFNGITTEELKRELNFPYSIKVYRQMSYHAAVNSALMLFNNLVRKVKWDVVEPKNATEEDKRRTEFIRECIDDMEQPWEDVISDALTMNIFGFSVLEKVYRRRLRANGSKYDDGLVGWKKLPIRNQMSIEKFIMSGDANEILGVKQNLSRIAHNYSQVELPPDLIKRIPRSKFLLFRTGNHRGNPYGVSPLRDAYVAWRYLTSIEELEANGVSKDISGIPLLKLPPQYLSNDASPEQKAIKDYFANALRNMQVNQQSGIMLPAVFDPDTRQPLFELSLLSNDGKRAYDTSKVKDYYQKAIYTSLACDILVMGQSSTGSYALGTLKSSITGAAVESMLIQIKNELNRDLIRQTFELNGWDVTRMPTLDYDGVEPVDLESLSKYWQRLASVSLVEVDRELLNSIRVAGGIDPKPLDEEVDLNKLSANTSRSGDGMSTPYEGTRKQPGSGDDNSQNMDNKA